MEQEKQLQAPISIEEIKEKLHQRAISYHQMIEDDFEKGILHLRDYSGVRKFKSIRRAIRRGHVSLLGEVYPKRPFKNISTKHNRNGKVVEVKTITYMKKRYYEQLTHKNRKVA